MKQDHIKSYRQTCWLCCAISPCRFLSALSRNDDRQTQLDHLNLVLSFSLRAIQTRRQTDTSRSLKSCTVVFFTALSRNDDRQTQLDHLNLVLSFSHRAIQTRRQTDTTRSLKSCTVVFSPRYPDTTTDRHN